VNEIQKRNNGEIAKEGAAPATARPDVLRVRPTLDSRDATRFTAADALVLRQVSDWGDNESVHFESERARDVSTNKDGTITVTTRTTTKLTTSHYEKKPTIVREVKAGMTDEQRTGIIVVSVVGAVLFFLVVMAAILSAHPHP
jgi:hypothetical protein